MDLQPLSTRDETVVIVGFFDLLGYARWCEDRPPRELLNLAMELFDRTGHAINTAGGRLIKAIGDAGLFVFPADELDHAVLELKKMKHDCDKWLAELGYPNVLSVKVQVGPVACGKVGPPEDRRLDIYGSVVNRAALMRGRTFTVAVGLFDQLSRDFRQEFVRFDEDEFVAKS